MKKLVSLLAVLTLIIGSFGFIAQPVGALNLNGFSFNQASTILAVEGQRRNEADDKLASDYGQKIDLNNANVRLFRQYKGFYPSLAAQIVKNAPYDKVEDVLNIPGLSDKQKERLQSNLENFTVTEPSSVFLDGDERLNNGNY